MSSIITTVVLHPRLFEQACCLVAFFVLVLPDVVHLLQLQHLHYEYHDKLHRAGNKQIKLC